MREKQRRNQLISAWPQGLNKALPIDCVYVCVGVGLGGYREPWLIADHKQLTGDTVLPPTRTTKTIKIMKPQSVVRFG